MAGKLEFIPYAATLKLKREAPLPAEKWGEAGAEFLKMLAKGCHEKGAAIIGHIKGFLDLGEAGYFYLSTVGVEYTPSCRGIAAGKTDNARLDLNVLVYGISRPEIASLVETQAISWSLSLKIIFTLREASHLEAHHR
ncbi:hypothetical protein SAMN00808754_3124 [Thermanaeromonas toyohensis ToBE]|uniref:Uncharacterized protein n=1 Tax=Thermanaeromonas toyohensis ToBE TaxID=698762 RepID=A0A1W1W2M9_9FIRM|nr:hypothetical protein [Thermanaeromonas toyohensis]SMB99865.1 hypothetical protein SAMN00808754_3124 [Thermanaeromonas toyohensis ToBE]